MESIEALLEAAVDDFPNGLHDALLERVPSPTYRRARFVVEGLVDCSIGAAAYQDERGPLWIVDGLEAPPDGSLFDTSRNRYIHFCGRSATCAFLD